jgi:putative methionine-R-sulfoxide reductase with GAF domain
MARSIEEMLQSIRGILASGESREQRARKLADAIRNFGNYRWVGVYDVKLEFVCILAWSGPGAPANPTFPITKGLTGSAVAQKASVVVGDVSKDPRYLTAFGSTRSEIIVPVIDPQAQNVVGTIDVESEQADAFSEEDRRTLERCAASAIRLWEDPSNQH